MFRNFTKYEVYEDGRIWSYSHKKFLKLETIKDGYQRVCLLNNEGKIKKYLVHRVVYEAVTGNPIPEGLQVNHIDEDKTNNHITNLNLMTCKQNNNYGTRTERAAKAHNKQVGAYRNGELVMTFQSTMEAKRNGFSQSGISECCNGKRKTHKGYEWKYIYINEKEI